MRAAAILASVSWRYAPRCSLSSQRGGCASAGYYRTVPSSPSDTPVRPLCVRGQDLSPLHPPSGHVTHSRTFCQVRQMPTPSVDSLWLWAAVWHRLTAAVVGLFWKRGRARDFTFCLAHGRVAHSRKSLSETAFDTYYRYIEVRWETTAFVCEHSVSFNHVHSKLKQELKTRFPSS